MEVIDMKVAICDDDLNQLRLIKSSIEQYALHHEEHSFEIDCFSNPFEFLEHIEKTDIYDILILDIFMPGIMGIDIAKQIRSSNKKIEIIFLTSSQDYAVQAFSLKATHYIVKPYEPEEFIEAIDRALHKLNYRKNNPISIKVENGNVRFVELFDIMYVESYRHSQMIHLRNGEFIEARETLTKLFTLFEEASKGQFISPYKGFIVNLSAIKLIELGQIILKNGEFIPIVKRNFKSIKQDYFNFMFSKECG